MTMEDFGFKNYPPPPSHHPQQKQTMAEQQEEECQLLWMQSFF